MFRQIVTPLQMLSEAADQLAEGDPSRFPSKYAMYEDGAIIVLNKQPDIIVHPARSHLKGTMLSALHIVAVEPQLRRSRAH